MTIDTEERRKSAASVNSVWNPPSVVPKGNIYKSDRWNIGWSYAGWLFGPLKSLKFWERIFRAKLVQSYTAQMAERSFTAIVEEEGYVARMAERSFTAEITVEL